MKLIIGATLLLALMAPQPAAMAQSSNPTNPTAPQVATLRKARLKIWTGITLLTAGGLLLPITAVNRQDLPENVAMGSMALMGAGSGLVYWGVQQRRQAVHPSTTFGVTFGHRRGVLVRRSW